MRINLRIHGSREEAYNKAAEAGLSPQACDYFRFAAEEHLVTYEVDCDGAARAVALDGKELNES
jgi:hypothetical protein